MAYHDVFNHHRWTEPARKADCYSEESSSRDEALLCYGSERSPGTLDVQRGISLHNLDKRQGSSSTVGGSIMNILEPEKTVVKQTGELRPVSKVTQTLVGPNGSFAQSSQQPGSPESLISLTTDVLSSRIAVLATPTIPLDPAVSSFSTRVPRISSATPVAWLIDNRSTAIKATSVSMKSPHSSYSSAATDSGSFFSEFTHIHSARPWISTSSTHVSFLTRATDGSTLYLNTPSGADVFGGLALPTSVKENPQTTMADNTATSTARSLEPAHSPSLTPAANKIVGGVVGGVAGVTFVFLIVFLYFRRRHASLRSASLCVSPGDISGNAAREESFTQSTEEISELSSRNKFFSLSLLAPLLTWHRPRSMRAVYTDGTLTPDQRERSFQKVSGRKIPSVLQSGGDGYGDEFQCEPSPEAETSIASAPMSSLHLEANISRPHLSNFYGTPVDVDYVLEARESDFSAGARRSPIWSPTASSTNIAPIRATTPPRSIAESRSMYLTAGPGGPDALGRSHPSLDGSRCSRFTEGL